MKRSKTLQLDFRVEYSPVKDFCYHTDYTSYATGKSWRYYYDDSTIYNRHRALIHTYCGPIPSQRALNRLKSEVKRHSQIIL